MQLALSDHVYHFMAVQGSPRGLERKKAHPEIHEPFYEAMVLLDKIVEILPFVLASSYIRS